MKKTNKYLSIIISALLSIIILSGCADYSIQNTISESDAKKAATTVSYQKAKERFGHIKTFGYSLLNMNKNREDEKFYYFRGEMILNTGSGTGYISVNVEVDKITGEALVTYFL